MIRKIALSLASLFLFCSGLEALARLRYSPGTPEASGIFEYDPDKLYALKRNYVGIFAGRAVRTSSLGYRDAEIRAVKPEGTVRILVLGDSIAFGHGVEVEATFAEILERRLAAEGDRRSFEVINTAVPGNSPFQEVVDLERAASLAPDAVVLQLTLNDVVEPYQVFRRFGGAGRDYHRIEDLPRLHYMLSERSAFYLLLRDVWTRASLRVAGNDGLKAKAWEREEYQLKRLVDSADDPHIREAWAECLRAIERIASFCRQRGWPLVIVYVPASFQLALPPSLARPQEIIRAFAAERRIPVLDLLEPLHATLSEQADSSDRDAAAELWSRYFLDANHLNESGHQWVAERLQELLAAPLGQPARPGAGAARRGTTSRREVAPAREAQLATARAVAYQLLSTRRGGAPTTSETRALPLVVREG